MANPTQLSYKEQLLDPRWQKKRLKILERDNFRCKYRYEDTKTLMVHHTIYEKNKMAWEALDETLITLCNECHEEFHKNVPGFLKTISDNFKTKIRDLFIMRCTADVFSSYKDLHGLMYLLWELKDKEDEVMSFLSDLAFPGRYELSNFNEVKMSKCQELER